MEYEVYCDESCWEALYDQNAHSYSVIGGIWIPSEKRSELKEAIKAIKTKYAIRGEIKWKHICPSSIEMYEEIVKLFFAKEYIQFRAICIESAALNHDRFNHGNGELGFYKFYFQLLHHWMFINNSYQIFLDHKVNGYQHRVLELGRILQKTSTATLKQIQALPSNESALIQIADVFTGAVASEFNSKESSSLSKQKVRDIIVENIKHPIKATPSYEKKFNVFLIDLRRD